MCVKWVGRHNGYIIVISLKLYVNVIIQSTMCFILFKRIFILFTIYTYNSSIGTLDEQWTEINIHTLYMKNERGDKSNSSNSDLCLD